MREAVVTAASLRLRPILMTTGAMVLGALPLALASGAGAESRRQIGWVIVGGMSLGTLLTIFVVPTVYTWFARQRVPGEITERRWSKPRCRRSRRRQARGARAVPGPCVAVELGRLRAARRCPDVSR